MKPETKIGVLSPDPAGPPWLCVIAAWRAGGTWVPLNPNSPITDSIGFVNRLDRESLSGRPALPRLSGWGGRAVGDRIQYIRLEGEADAAECVRGCATHPAPSLGDSPSTHPRVDVPQDSVAMISPTGGTTGAPKGVMNTHRSFSMCVAQLMLAMHYRADEKVVNLAAAPMTHSAGMLTLPATARGGAVVVLKRPDPETLLESIDRYNVTDLFLPPTVIYRLIEHPDLANYDLTSLRYFLYGSAPMSAENLRKCLKVLGPVMIECFGQTEAPGSISFLRPEQHFVDGEYCRRRPIAVLWSAVGQLLIRVEIRDDEDNALPSGERGKVSYAETWS